jgi:hypothetical protein
MLKRCITWNSVTIKIWNVGIYTLTKMASYPKRLAILDKEFFKYNKKTATNIGLEINTVKE